MSRRSNLITLAAIALVVLGSLFWYRSVALMPKPLMIGFVAGLSGFNSDLGVSGRNGALAAVRDINANGGIRGRMLELVVKDDHGMADKALEVAKEFKWEEIDFVIGPMTSQAAEKTVDFANSNDMLFVSPTVAAEILTAKDDNFVRTIPSNRTQAFAISQQLIADGVMRASVVIDSSNMSFTKNLSDMFASYYRSAGGTLVSISYYKPFGTVDSELLEDLQTSGTQGLFVIGGSDTAANVSQQIFQQGITTKLYFPTWAMTEDLIQHGGEAVEGAALINFFNAGDSRSNYVDFRKSYKRSFGSEPSFGTIFSYDAVSVLAQALMDTDSTDSVTVKKALVSKTFQGLQGPLRFDEYGDVSRPNYIYHIQQGQFAPRLQR